MNAVCFKEINLDPTEMSRLEWAIELIGQQPTHVIESHHMGQNGPYVSSVFLLFDHCLAEVRVSGGSQSFDVIDRNMVENYRVTLGDFQLKKQPNAAEQPPPPIETIMNAEIEITHRVGLGTTMAYFGSDAKGWIEFVLAALPITMVVRK
jgi:hypothetical protein